MTGFDLGAESDSVERAALPAEVPGGALGRNPFDERVEVDPVAVRLDAIEGSAPRAPVTRTRPPARRERGAAPRRHPALAAAAPRPPRMPRLAEIEPPEPRSWLEALLGEDERRILAAFAHLVEGEGPYDRFGLSPEALRIAFPILQLLYRGYFRVTSSGHAHIPVRGPAILVANHGGLLPFDAAMAVVDIALHTDPPRLLRSVVDRWAGTLPWVNVFYARVGQVVGTRENVAGLLDEGQLLLVFPEGMDGIRKTLAQRYRLQHFHVGFIEHALRARAPIVPTAIVGSDDQAPVLYDVRSLARRLGLPLVPITPTFPWLGPLGLLPYPVRTHIVYGEPLDYHERFGPEGADDARLVHYLAKQARRGVQQLLDRSRS